MPVTHSMEFSFLHFGDFESWEATVHPTKVYPMIDETLEVCSILEFPECSLDMGNLKQHSLFDVHLMASEEGHWGDYNAIKMLDTHDAPLGELFTSNALECPSFARSLCVSLSNFISYTRTYFQFVSSPCPN